MRNIKLLWGLTVILSAAVLVLGLLVIRLSGREQGLPDAAAPDPEAERVVAKIGGREFTLGVLEEQLMDKHGAELINQLLDREAVRLESERIAVKVTREEVDRELKRMQQGYDSEEQFYESMKTQVGMSKEEIREDVYYKLLLDAVATSSIKVSGAEVDAYIKEHPEEFHMASLLRIGVIVNKTADQAKRTLELFRSGKDFAQLAKERSLDTASAAEGGDLGWVEDNDPFIPQEYLKAARTLKVGDVAGPVETDGGFAVILLKDKKDQSKGSMEEIRARVTKQLALQKAPPLQDILQSLRKKYDAVILDPALK
ncbi:foldase protein PrsA [Gorillibacterium sp. sgz5001074]|uniref:peptidylprolyl isomerase n=1 Tax=Gorillibacterium sp. sgz5001074 TaxID=3446695 RepID=UPI003F680BBD